MKKNNTLDLISVPKLSTYFYDQLQLVNKQIVCSLPEEMIFYSSEILESYLLKPDINSKALGLELLKAQNETSSKQKKIFKDVGDTTLVLVGCFSESINGKLVDQTYYTNIGKMAYAKMSSLNQKFFDIPHFYKMMETRFESLVTVLNIFSKTQMKNNSNLVMEVDSKEELLLLGATPNIKKLVS